jgi:cell shape-determining protein MreC
MSGFLNTLKLIHKVNIVFYISIVVIMVLIGVFYTISSIMTKNLQDNYNEQLKIQKCSNEITDNLKLLDYLTIENSLTKQTEYIKKS